MWTPFSREDQARADAFVSILRSTPQVEWEGIEPLERGIILFIKTAREANQGRKTLGGQYGDDWFPTISDWTKSALFERIRSGKDPLPEPPPLGYSCPWYAVVEDQTPHVIPFGAEFGNPWKRWNFDADVLAKLPQHDDFVSILQNTYEIVERKGEGKEAILTIKDRGHDTDYRWKLWFDPTWKHPTSQSPDMQNGAWMMQIIDA